MYQKSIPNDQKGTKRESKGSQSEQMNVQKHRRDFWQQNWITFYQQNRSNEKHPKNDHRETFGLNSKGYQKGASIDANTHQKTMQTLAKNKSWTSSENMFLRMVKAFKNSLYKYSFKGFAGCVRERKRYQRTDSKWYNNPSTNRCNIDTSVMLEKVVQTIQKVIPKRFQ